MNLDRELEMKKQIADVASDPQADSQPPRKIYGVATELFPTVDAGTRNLNLMYQNVVQCLMRVSNEFAPTLCQRLNLTESEAKGCLIVALEQMLAAVTASHCDMSPMRHQSLNNELNRVLKRFSRDSIVIPKKRLVVPDVQTPLQPGPPASTD